LITLEELEGVDFWRQAAVTVQKPDLSPDLLRHCVVRFLIDWQVRDLVGHTLEQLKKQRIGSVNDVRRASGLLVGWSPVLTPLKADLERFLHQRVYEHYRVLRMKRKGARVLKALFEEFSRQPQLLPEGFARRRQHDPVQRMVCDYLAGMTDRFAQQEYLRLFHPTVDV
jgi:dGTPase